MIYYFQYDETEGFEVCENIFSDKDLAWFYDAI